MPGPLQTYCLVRRQRLALPIGNVFSFFSDPHNLDLLTPPYMHFRIESQSPDHMAIGTRLLYTIRWRGLPMRWLTEIVEWEPGRRFVDQQIRGPYRRWHHTHTFEPDGDGTIMEDIVEYALPLGPIGRLAHALMVRRDVHQIFDYRAQRIAEWAGGAPLAN
ncbi:Polyketide cyclase / dehydrase and lipid transport [Phycisphaerae bacterium RAS2]|nr:Polyketide cyclase / dehydrase and lipid transport [Phycisphaerae bacterium RAS2]